MKRYAHIMADHRQLVPKLLAAELLARRGEGPLRRVPMKPLGRNVRKPQAEPDKGPDAHTGEG